MVIALKECTHANCISSEYHFEIIRKCRAQYAPMPWMHRRKHNLINANHVQRIWTHKTMWSMAVTVWRCVCVRCRCCCISCFFGIVHCLGEFDLSKDSHFIPLVWICVMFSCIVIIIIQRLLKSSLVCSYFAAGSMVWACVCLCMLFIIFIKWNVCMMGDAVI